MTMVPMIQGRPVTILGYTAPAGPGTWRGTWADDPDGPVWAVDDDQVEWVDEDDGPCPAGGEHHWVWVEAGIETGLYSPLVACDECHAPRPEPDWDDDFDGAA